MSDSLVAIIIFCLAVAMGVLVGYAIAAYRAARDHRSNIAMLDNLVEQAHVLEGLSREEAAELVELRDFKAGLWSQKPCLKHTFKRDPDVRKKTTGRTLLLYHCVTCSTPVWTSKPDRL